MTILATAFFLLVSLLVQPVALAQAAPTSQVFAAVSKHRHLKSRDHTHGPKTAEVIMIEYADMQCPYCAMNHPVLAQLVDEYDGQVAWVYRHFPLSFHEYADTAARASECIFQQGKNDAFWKYIDLVYERQTELDEDLLNEIAQNMGMNMAKFSSCLDRKKTAKRVEKDLELGMADDVAGTPTTILIDSDGSREVIVGAQPIDAYRAAINELLAD